MADSLNTWIKEVETMLSDLSPGERAQAVIELDHQLRKLPLVTYDEICQTLGSPAQVANRYRLNLGKNPFDKTKQNSIVTEHYKSTYSKPVGSGARRFFKFATFVVLGFFCLLILSIFVIPLAIFRYMSIDAFDKQFHFSFGPHRSAINRFEGNLGSSQLSNFTFNLSNGSVTVDTEPNLSKITYDCEVEGNNPIQASDAAKVEGATAKITLMNVDTADCDISVPENINLSINVTNGKISFDEAKQNVEANLTTGELEFEAADDARFDLQATTQVGRVTGLDDFNSRQKKKKGPQFTATLSVGTGEVEVQ